MRRRYIIFLGSLLLSGGISAQQVPTGSSSFTLEQCLQYALENSINMQNALIDQEIAQAKVKETTGLGLPQISGNASANYNNQLQRFFSTKQRSAGFAGITQADYPNFLPGVKDDDVVALPNFFQLKGSAMGAVSVNQLLFNYSYLLGRKASKALKELAANSSDQTKEQVIVQVTKAFYLALINRQRINLFDNNIARVDSLLKNTKALNVNGFAEGIDVDRIEVSLNNLITQRDQFVRLQLLSLEALKLMLNYPMDQPLDVLGDLSAIQTQVNLEDYMKNWNYQIRPDYQVLETNRKLQLLNIQNKKAAGMPALNANATAGYFTGSSDISGLFKTNSNFSDNGKIGPDKYYPYSSVGVSLTVPIFSGFQRTYQVQQERLALRKIDNNFKLLKSNVDFQVKQSVTNYQNNVKSLESQKRNMTLAANVARITKIKYEQGVGSNIEVIDAENSLKESQINYYSALYEVLIAKIDMEKAFGVLANNTN